MSYYGPISVLRRQTDRILRKLGAGEAVFEAFHREKAKEPILLHCFVARCVICFFFYLFEAITIAI